MTSGGVKLTTTQDGPVRFRVEDAVAIVSIANPPVNALGAPVRSALLKAINHAKSASEIKALVITSEGKMFSGGADIKEFGKPPISPILSEVIAALVNLGKPSIAAIRGVAFGGGLELPLACDARVVTPDARVGLPEIKLGLLPGAGGTQRLPRLIGAKAAFEIMLKGDPVPAKKALALGIVDQVADGDLLAAAKAKALKLVEQGTRYRSAEEGIPVDLSEFEAAASQAIQQNAGSPNVSALVECVRAVFDKPFAEGLAFERAQFVKLLQDDRSKALRYVFFSDRASSHIAGLPADAAARKIERGTVIGAGTMGAGIAICFLNAGIPVTVVETNEDALAKGLQRIAGSFDSAVKRGSLTAEDRDRKLALIKGETSLDAAKDADIVIEAVFEEMPLKKEIFAALDKIAKPGAILATNTSYLDVNEIANATARPEDVLGLHFFSPANIMRLLEVVRGAKTSASVLRTAVELAPKLGKIPVVVGVCHGFVGNRMLSRRSAQAERMLAEGALPHEIDAAMVSFGFRMGPFATGDLAGLDIGWRMRKATGVSAPVADALCERGRFGQKTGRGYYLYPEGARTGIPDPEVEEIIKNVSHRLGIERRTISQEEIIDRLTLPMVNEGARILAEGIAARASDIDVIWRNGYNWPAWRGGPMYYADHLGLRHVASRLEALAATSGDPSLRPAPLLLELAASGGAFTATPS